MKLINGIIGWFKYISGLDKADGITIANRKIICRQCEYHDTWHGRLYCQVCRCDLNAKAAIKSEKCPMEKW